MIGQRLLHYEITEKLGEGGMGVVYKARDTHLDRFVAIKVLPAEKVADPERKRRFVQEAKAASALHHSNIITIYDISADSGHDFIAMEFVEGKTLDALIPRSGMRLQEALGIAAQIAGALGAAHDKGIVHRDLKPGNVMVMPDGTVKVLDFGLAKLTEPAVPSPDAETRTMGAATEEGTILGTVAYMSPEQAEGKPVDARSDVFSFGVVLYEMLSGRRPFQGDSVLSILTAILREPPAHLLLPPALASVLARCLEKDRARRYPSATEVAQDLAAAQARLATRSFLWRPWFAIPALALALTVAAAGAWLTVRASRIRWATNVALPEINHLRQQGKVLAAYRLAHQVEPYLPREPVVQEIRRELISVSFRTTPPGADVDCRDYADAAGSAQWERLGRTPIEMIELPPTMLRCRITKQGFEPVEVLRFGATSDFRLHPPDAHPRMVFVPRGAYTSLVARDTTVEDFWLDKYEVTNRQFKEFVDHGGYRKRDFWKYPFLKNGRTLTWEQAMAEFHDATGRPGPAVWQLGAYPEGRDDFPANGVSWYEAAAFAEFAGKSLPTVHHWFRAALPTVTREITRASNFGGAGPARVGSFSGVGQFGAYDMAGNVKEWCLNPTGERRYLLGGAWSEGAYLYSIPDAADPFERLPTYGFRCATYLQPQPEALAGPFQFVSRDRSKDKPVGDNIFRVYRDLHSYDKTELRPSVEAVDDTSPYWRKEKVSFAAAYGNERVIAQIFLPKNAIPPYHTVVYFPGATALSLRSSEPLPETVSFEFLVRSGRAVIYPIYKGTYERGPSMYYHRFGQPNQWREMNIQWSKDLGRTLDYLEIRSEFDRARFAYCGVSLGAAMAPRLMAVESRLRTGVLVMGGFFEPVPPEVDALNFAPRVNIPVLMLNGRNDYLFPLANQAQLFRLLGTPEKDKRRVVFDGGHELQTAFRDQVIKEVLDWLDRYLGPVALR